MGAEGVVRVDGDGVVHLVHQRQVVVGVAVEAALFEALPAQAEALEPGLDPLDLARLEGRYAAGLAGEGAVLLGRDGGHQVRDAEGAGDGARDEAVGGRHDGHDGAGFEVFLDQRLRLGRHHRPDAGVEELLVPGVELGTAVAGEGLQLEVEELEDVEGAGLVLVVEGLVAGLIDLPVEDALGDQKLGPLEIRVAGEQGVVEVEEDEIHFYRFSS